MKKVLIVILLIQGFVGFSQQGENNLKEAYGADKAGKLESKNKFLYDYLSFYSTEGYYFETKAFRADEKYTKLSDVKLKPKTLVTERPVFSKSDFNPLVYSFVKHRKASAIYRIDGTDEVIVFYSEEEFIKEFNKKTK